MGDMRYEVRVTGKVQGVGFRAAAHQLAGEHEVVGWVRNEPDGSVSIVAEGDSAKLEAFLSAIRSSMENFITHLHHDEAEERGTYSAFEVRY